MTRALLSAALVGAGGFLVGYLSRVARLMPDNLDAVVVEVGPQSKEELLDQIDHTLPVPPVVSGGGGGAGGSGRAGTPALRSSAPQQREKRAAEGRRPHGSPKAPAQQDDVGASKGAWAGGRYGFYLHVYRDPAAVIYQVRSLKKWMPKSPVYIMSDGGLDFAKLCTAEYKDSAGPACTAVLCPPANDRWHPWPFLHRLHDAAQTLDTEFVIMLEPDNTVHGPITRHPDADAGGIYVKDRGFGMKPYIEKLARKRKPGYKWTDEAQSTGLAGGSYYRTAVILDSFNDDAMLTVGWNYLAEHGTKEVFSSDFAMQFLLASRGWALKPWADSAQMDKHKDQPITGPKDSAFRHYCSCYPGGKPTYNIPLAQADQRLFQEPPAKYSSVNSNCQLCYNLTKYKANWKTDRCTNKHEHVYSKTLMQRYHPEVLTQCPADLFWLCNVKTPYAAVGH